MAPDVIEEILLIGLDDWIHLPEVAWVAKSAGGAQSEDDVMNVSLEAIRELLGAGLVQIGDVTQATSGR